MRIHFLIAIVVLSVTLFLDVSRLEFIVLLFSIALVLAAELINTAIEAAIDVVTTSFDPLAKIAKDVAAGAVLVASVNAIFVGYFVFFRRLNPYTLSTLQKIRHSPIYITYVVLILVILFVIVAKALAGQTSFFRGGWISGHAALAFSASTAIAFLSGDTFVATLAFFIALVVSHSRIESQTHTIWEVSLGATIGVLITVLVFQLFFPI